MKKTLNNEIVKTFIEEQIKEINERLVEIKTKWPRNKIKEITKTFVELSEDINEEFLTFWEKDFEFSYNYTNEYDLTIEEFFNLSNSLHFVFDKVFEPIFKNEFKTIREKMDYLLSEGLDFYKVNVDIESRMWDKFHEDCEIENGQYEMDHMNGTLNMEKICNVKHSDGEAKAFVEKWIKENE